MTMRNHLLAKRWVLSKCWPKLTSLKADARWILNAWAKHELIQIKILNINIWVIIELKADAMAPRQWHLCWQGTFDICQLSPWVWNRSSFLTQQSPRQQSSDAVVPIRNKLRYIIRFGLHKPFIHFQNFNQTYIHECFHMKNHSWILAQKRFSKAFAESRRRE